MTVRPPRVLVVLNQFKRKNLIEQVRRIQRQTLDIDEIVVVNNVGTSVDSVDHAKRLGCSVFDIGHNTGYFGRFAVALVRPFDYVCIVDDDMFLGRRCLEHYVNQCRILNAIVGANGRRAASNQDTRVVVPRDFGIRRKPHLVDFVGHVWVCRQEWIRNMFDHPPVTFDTGEDMHLCFTAKLHLGIPSIVGSQVRWSHLSDQHMNIHAGDKFAGFRSPSHQLRERIEKKFQSEGLKFVTREDQLNFHHSQNNRSDVI